MEDRKVLGDAVIKNVTCLLLPVLHLHLQEKDGEEVQQVVACIEKQILQKCESEGEGGKVKTKNCLSQ